MGSGRRKYLRVRCKRVVCCRQRRQLSLSISASAQITFRYHKVKPALKIGRKQKASEWEEMRDRKDLPGSCLAAFVALTAGAWACHAQMPLASAAKPTGADLFNQQCATCHSLNPADPPRQGPLLAGVYGRKPGSVAGFHYSPGYDKADFIWDEAHLDPYLADPQAVIPHTMMLYKQKNADVRKAIISFLKEHK